MNDTSRRCSLGSKGPLDASRSWKAARRLAAVVFLLATLPAAAQTKAPTGRVGLPEDWSHHHVVFSGAPPESPEVVRAVVSDARFRHQQIRRAPLPRAANKHAGMKKPRVDWSVNLGGSGSRLAAGAFPAKYTFDINATPDCTNDFAVFGLNIAGSGSQATIVAYNNLYTGTSPAGKCVGSAPTVKWAYNTGGAINTSPVLSLDGKKVAWIAGTGSPVLHVLTVGTSGSNGTAVNSPATPGSGNNAADATVSFGSIGDARSSLFVDYSNDVGYAASDDGNIHKFTGIFHGTPAEVSGGWPLHGQDAGSHVLTSVVYDSVSKNLFYGSDAGTFGYVRETGSTRGVCASGSPPCLGLNSYSLSGAIIDAPVVDPVAQNVFAFVGNNGGSHAAVQQADTQLSSNGPQANIGENGGNIFAGAFDNNYYISPASGSLYVCGYPASGTASPTLYQIGFDSSNNLNTIPEASTLLLSSLVTTCSPMTEIFNPPTLKDWLFVSVGNGCAITGGGTGGCVMSFDITSGFPTLPATQKAQPEINGTSGIVVDNVSTAAQASSIYFSTQGDSTLGSPCGDGVSGTGCAIKLTQSGLQ